jgi:hypothetical protein
VWSVRENRELQESELLEQAKNELLAEHAEYQGLDEWRRARLEPLIGD